MSHRHLVHVLYVLHGWAHVNSSLRALQHGTVRLDLEQRQNWGTGTTHFFSDSAVTRLHGSSTECPQGSVRTVGFEHDGIGSVQVFRLRSDSGVVRHAHQLPHAEGE